MIIAAKNLPYKILVITAFLLFAAFFQSAVLAQDTATSSTIKKERIEARKENIAERMATVKERIATKEAALRERLAKFKDKQKAQIAERINSSLANINAKITAAMSRHLEVMSKLLDKLEARVNANTPDIKDPAAVRSAISDAKAAIDAAKAAVESQAGNEYVIEATSEAKIKDDAKVAKDKLHADLKNLREMVVNAKQKVSDAIRIAKSNAGKEKESGQ